jgi:hypothetical protein
MKDRQSIIWWVGITLGILFRVGLLIGQNAINIQEVLLGFASLVVAYIIGKKVGKHPTSGLQVAAFYSLDPLLTTLTFEQGSFHYLPPLGLSLVVILNGYFESTKLHWLLAGLVVSTLIVLVQPVLIFAIGMALIGALFVFQKKEHRIITVSVVLLWLAGLSFYLAHKHLLPQNILPSVPMFVGRAYQNLEFIASGFRRADGTLLGTKYYMPHIGTLFALVGVYHLFKYKYEAYAKAILIVLFAGLVLALFDVLTLKNSLFLQTFIPLLVVIGFQTFFGLLNKTDFTKKLKIGILIIFVLQILFLFLEIAVSQLK